MGQSQGIGDILTRALGPVSRPAGGQPPRQVAMATAPVPDAVLLSQASGPLKKLLAGTEPTTAEWFALSRQVAGMRPAERAAWTTRLAAMGVKLDTVDNGRIVYFEAGALSVAVDPAAGRMRRWNGAAVEVFEGGALATRMQAADNRVTVTRGRRQEVWNALGTGSVSGVAISAPAARPVPGEAPRAPWGIPPRNHFQLPLYRAGEDPGQFLAKIDAAVLRSGGKILVSANAADRENDWFNCFSYALTQGAGDLADPYGKKTLPRWLNSPGYQLTSGQWGKLAPTQQAHVGDILIYKNGSGDFSHAGVVRQVDTDGNPSLVESKFGAWGIYLHKPFDTHPEYGIPTEIYRRAGT